MKITVWPDGRYVFEIDPGDDELRVLALARAFQGQRHRQAKAVGTQDFQRGDVFTVVLAYLANHDRQGGVEISVIAEALDISYYAAGYRLGQLAKRGDVQRVTRGHYRAITADAEVTV